MRNLAIDLGVSNRTDTLLLDRSTLGPWRPGHTLGDSVGTMTVAGLDPMPVAAFAQAETLSDAMFRDVFRTVPGAVGFATVETPGQTQVYLVMEGGAEEAAIRAFLSVRRALGDYTMRFLTLTPAEADEIDLSESARPYRL